MHTLLSRASTHTCTSAHPPPNLDFLRSSVQPPTILNSCVVNLNVGPLSSHSCDCSDALWAPWHQASKVCTHPSMVSFAVFFPCSMKFMYCKWWLNVAETWQRGYKSVRFAAQYSFLHCQAGLDEARTKWQCGTPWKLVTLYQGWTFAWR